MRRGDRFPGDQAEIVFGDAFIEYLDRLTGNERLQIVSDVVELCGNPGGKHALSNQGGVSLSGLNTLDVLGGEHRVVFQSRVVDEVGTIEVLCAGPRGANEVYTLAGALVGSGRLAQEEIDQIWQSLELLDIVAEDVGLDGWDYAPPPAPEGMRKAAVASGLLDQTTADLLSKDEIEAAQTSGWSITGPDPHAALAAAADRARGSARKSPLLHFDHRKEPRCHAVMPRAKALCIRKVGHPGAHRSAT